MEILINGKWQDKKIALAYINMVETPIIAQMFELILRADDTELYKAVTKSRKAPIIISRLASLGYPARIVDNNGNELTIYPEEKIE